MKNVFKICIAILTLLFYSCGKNSTEDDSTENDICNKFFLDNAIIDTLMINKDKHSFVNSDGYPFYDSILTSLQDRHVYKIKMIKNIEYRISASQPNTISSQINLTLINNKCDTLASSKVENSQKSKLIIKSPETADYYLIVKLFPGSNPTFGYRLNFEELFENEISFSGFDWFCDGTWDISNSNTASLTHHDSFIYRHLILKSTGTENPDLSFVIQSNSTIHPSFGVIIGGYGGLLEFSEYAYEFTKYGQAFLAYYDKKNYTVIQLYSNSMSYYWTSLPDNLDFSLGIKVELKYDVNGKTYELYLNNNHLDGIRQTTQLQDFYILILDCGKGTTIIKNFNLTN